jgi:hypothetical protein
MILRTDGIEIINPRAIAIHEAGHAVIAYALKIKILSIVMDADSSGCVSTEDEPRTSATQSNRDLLNRHMTVAVAGDQAERHAGYAPDNGRCAKDYERANRLAWALEPNRNAWDLAAIAHARAEELLAHPAIWSAVEAVANRLAETKKLCGEDACVIISRHLGPPGGFTDPKSTP